MPDRLTTNNHKIFFDIFLAISNAVSTTKDLDELFPIVHTTLKRGLDIDNFYIALIDEDGDRLIYPYVQNQVGASLPMGNISDRDTNSLPIEVIRTNKPIFVTETEIKKRNVKGIIPKVWIGIPLRIKGMAIGLMAVQHDSNSNQYSRREVEMLTAVSELLSLGVERRINEDALVVHETQYRTILDNIIEGYYEVDLFGNFTFFNASMCNMLGYSPKELMGMNNRRFMDAENAKKVFRTFNEAFRSGKIFQGFDWVLIRKDGAKCYIETSVALIRNKKNDPIGFRGLARDVTARKLSEEEKKHMEKQLQHAQRMESIGTLAGGIAHNFNNLLMAIQGYATMLLLDAEPDGKQYRMLQSIEKQVTAGSRLTSQLLGYAREGKYEIKPINLNQLVRETSETFAMAKQEIRVHYMLESNLGGIIADRGQIEQVLMNLLINAADAMPKGGDLYLKTENVTHKEIHTDRFLPKTGAYVCLIVKDTGIGMEPKTMEHIFEPFFTTKDISKGSGLGLASAYGIVKAHGGYLQVQSRKDQGAAFHVYLPSTPKSIAFKKKQKEAAIKGEGIVLFVDDDDTVRALGNDFLKVLGYETIIAKGGREAVDIYRKRGADIDLVILDMIMPDMGGGAVYDQLRTINANIKVLLSSGYSIDGQATDILSRGCNGFIQKPFNLNDLSIKIQSILQKE